MVTYDYIILHGSKQLHAILDKIHDYICMIIYVRYNNVQFYTSIYNYMNYTIIKNLYDNTKSYIKLYIIAIVEIIFVNN